MSQKPYRPSNGTEGEIFESEWCENCEKDRIARETGDYSQGCEILATAMAFNINEPEYPKEWIMEDGRPKCTAFQEKE